MTSTDLLYSDPLAAATKAAAEIAERTGVASHDVALVMGSAGSLQRMHLAHLLMNVMLMNSLDFSLLL